MIITEFDHLIKQLGFKKTANHCCQGKNKHTNRKLCKRQYEELVIQHKNAGLMHEKIQKLNRT